MDFAAQEATLAPVQRKREGNAVQLKPAVGKAVQREESPEMCSGGPSAASSESTSAASNANMNVSSQETEPAPGAETPSGDAACDAPAEPKGGEAGSCLAPDLGDNRSEAGKPTSETTEELATCAPNALDAEAARLAHTLRRLAAESDALEPVTEARAQKELDGLEAAANASFETIGAARAKYDRDLIEAFEDSDDLLLGTLTGSIGAGADWALGEGAELVLGTVAGPIGAGVIAVAKGLWESYSDNLESSEKVALAKVASANLSSASIAVNGKMGSLLMRLASQGTLRFGKALGYLGAWRDSARSAAADLESLGAKVGSGEGEAEAERRGQAQRQLDIGRELQMAHPKIVSGLDAMVTAIGAPAPQVAAAGSKLAQKLEADFLSFQMDMKPVFTVSVTGGGGAGAIPNFFDRSRSMSGDVRDFTPPHSSLEVMLAVRRMFASNRGNELKFSVNLVAAATGRIEYRPGGGWTSGTDWAYFGGGNSTQGLNYLANVAEWAIMKWAGK